MHTREFADTEMSGIFSLLPLGMKAEARAANDRTPFTIENPEKLRRERERTARTERLRTLGMTQEALRIAEASAAAYADGKREGDRHGFRRGWKGGTTWGIFCGSVSTLAIGVAVVFANIGWLAGHIPH